MIERLPAEERVVMEADFNGCVGKGNNGIERTHGGHRYGRMNRDGERVVDLAVSFDLMITNTFFPEGTSIPSPIRVGVMHHK